MMDQTMTIAWQRLEQQGGRFTLSWWEKRPSGEWQQRSRTLTPEEAQRVIAAPDPGRYADLLQDQGAL